MSQDPVSAAVPSDFQTNAEIIL